MDLGVRGVDADETAALQSQLTALADRVFG
jgi:hypothetical protein